MSNPHFDFGIEKADGKYFSVMKSFNATVKEGNFTYHGKIRDTEEEALEDMQRMIDAVRTTMNVGPTQYIKGIN